jgi:hypothetical protein
MTYVLRPFGSEELQEALRINCFIEVEIRRSGCAKCTCYKMRTRRRVKRLIEMDSRRTIK